MNADREAIVEAAEKVRGGTPLRRFSPTTITGAGYCAQLVREVIEGSLGIPANTWEIAQEAHEARKKRGGVERWSTDYEAAARTLGLARAPGSEALPGDVLYWPYKARNGNDYGHTAIYLGDGLILENSDINAKRAVQLGSRQPLGAKSQVFVTPIERHGRPRTIAVPTKAILAAERVVPAPIITPAGPQATPAELSAVFPLYGVPGFDRVRVMKRSDGQGMKAYGIRDGQEVKS